MILKKKLPPLGMRIIKTAIAVMICLTMNYLFGANVAAISSWASVFCIQSTLESSLKTGLSRFLGTALGGVIAIAILPIVDFVTFDWFHIILIPAGIILVIYLCVLLKMPGSASMAAFVYIAVLILPFDPRSSANPYLVAFYRIADTLFGVLVGLLVNRFVFPPKVVPKVSVHVVANTYRSIYGKVKGDIPDDTVLILFDSALADPSLPKRAPLIFDGDFNLQDGKYDLRIPVPTEFQNNTELNCVYIGEGYNVDVFTLKETQGYVKVPGAFYPATVVWHTAQNVQKLNTYGIIHKKSDTQRHLKKGESAGKSKSLHNLLKSAK